MIVKVKLFGTLRLDTGIKELSLTASAVGDLFPMVEAEINKNKPDMITLSDLKNCLVFVNGKKAKSATRLQDGDEVVFLSPAAGG